MINPTEEDIGRGVVYRPKYGEAEDGAITSFNDRFVFVRYKKQHPSQPGQATSREDLYWPFAFAGDAEEEKDVKEFVQGFKDSVNNTIKSYSRAVGEKCEKCGSNHIGVVDHVLEKYKCMECNFAWMEECKKKCSHCCHIKVECTEIEARLAMWAAKNQNHAIDFTRAEKQANKNAGQWIKELSYEDRACVFLKDDQTCAVYEYRPIPCRKHASMDDPRKCDARLGDFTLAKPAHGEIEIYSAAMQTLFHDTIANLSEHVTRLKDEK